ncbi:hypothetical protein HQO82_12225 [Rhodococcus fascians]|nr:hypothetical protein [Rhodococcus fascians]MBY4114591.1 hypothetical protein [Rhodococcus fascians]
MIEVAHLQEFDAEAEFYGVEQRQWTTITAFYDNAAGAIEALVRADAFQITLWPSLTERYPAIVS